MDQANAADRTIQLTKLLHSSLARLAASVNMGVALFGCDGSLIDSVHWSQTCEPTFGEISANECFSTRPHPKTTTDPAVTPSRCTAGYNFISAPILSGQNQFAILIIGPFLLTESLRTSQEDTFPPLCTAVQCPRSISAAEQPWMLDLLAVNAEMIGLKVDTIAHERTTQKLKESHRQLQGFFQAAPLGLVVSYNKNLIKTNAKFCEITGYAADELINRSCRRFYQSDQEYARVHKELAQHMWQAGKMGYVETKCIRKDGSIRDIALFTAPIDPQDRKSGAAVVFQDITIQKANEEALRTSRDKLESLFRAVPVGLSILRKRHFHAVNEQMATITGYDKDEMILMHLRQFYGSHDEYIRVGEALYTTLWQSGRTDVETKMLRKDGTFRDVHISMTPIDIEDHEAGVAASCVDITERKTNEQMLRHHRGMLQSLFNAVPVGLTIIKNRTIAAINKPLADLLGYPMEDLIHVPTRKFYRSNEEFYRVREELYGKLWRKGRHHHVETELISADGSIHAVSLFAAAIDPNDPEAGAAVAIYDLTEQKNTQKQLQLNEDRFRTIADFTGQLLYDYDIKSGEIIWTGKTAAMTGFPLTELNQLGIEGWFDLVHPADRGDVMEELEAAIREHKLFQSAYRLQKADSSYIHLEEEGVPFYDAHSNPKHMIGIIRDVTSRVEMEQELIASENRYRTLFEAAGNAIIVFHDDIIIDCNQQALQIFRCTREELLGLSLIALSPEFQSDGIPSQYKIDKNNSEIEQGTLQKFEWLHQRFTGELFEAEIYLNPFEYSGMQCIHASLRDITYRKEAEKALRESEYRFRSFYDTNPEGIVLLDFEGVILDTNKAFLRESGYRLDQCVGHHFKEFLLDEYDQARVVEAFVSLKAGVANTVPLECSYKNANDTLIPVSAKGWLVVDNMSQPMYIGIFIKNLSVEKALSREKAALEKQIIQAQKSEAIGTLAGGIAHDFNNILGGIIGYTELALLKMEADEENSTRQYLQRVLEIGHRAKDLVLQILRFSRNAGTRVEPINLIPIVKESSRLLRSTIPSTITIQKNFNIEDDQILGDATQIHQVLMNLATNGYHAMKKTGGTLSIGLERVRLERCKRFLTMEIPPGEYIRLSIQDTGAGMSNTVLERIFEPYFTTKNVNEGTGLGLAVTLGIVKGHKGLIEVETELGAGTCFSLYLPRSTAEIIQNQTNDQRLPLGHGERILVVDDEEYFREIIREGLSLLGYVVDMQSNSPQTLQAFENDPLGYNLLITDLTMPELTGTQLARRVLALNPDLPIILCTGFSETVTEENASHFGIAQLLLKPINIEEMATAVRKVLDAAGTINTN